MGDVDDGVVAPGSAGEVFLGVVENGARADGSDEFDVGGAAYAGHFGPVRLGDLDGEGADAAGRSVDEDPLSGLDPSPVADRL